jgi:disulfide bond formation protein DsbB
MKRLTSKRTIFTLLIVSLLLLALSACATNETAEPTATVVEEAEEVVEEAAEASLSGAEIYAGLCVACHGADAKGITGLGKDLTTSEFLASRTDAEMIEFIIEGRAADHPDNSTGVAMPPRGGNPSLTDDDLGAVVTYLRSLVSGQ